MRAKFGRDPMAGSKKVTLKFIIGLCAMVVRRQAKLTKFVTNLFDYRCD